MYELGLLIMVCINKYDINEDMAEEIERFVIEKELALVGKIPYDDTVIKSINEMTPIIYYKDSIAGSAIKKMWDDIKELIY